MVFPRKRVAISKVSLSVISHPRSTTSYSCWRRRVKVCAFHPNISWSGGLRRFYWVSRKSTNKAGFSQKETCAKWFPHRSRWLGKLDGRGILLEIYVVFPWAARHGQFWVSTEEEKRPLSIWRQRGRRGAKREEKRTEIPPSGVVILQGLPCIWLVPEGQKLLPNTTIITCLATAH